MEKKDLPRGLKQVHIGDDAWKIGRVKNPNTNKAHCVIYGPNRKNYHVYGDDVKKLYTEYHPHYKNLREERYPPLGSYSNRHGNITIEASVKIYILTEILDERKNWCFDLETSPHPGKLKIIYNNGTVKNVDFNGTFEEGEIGWRGLQNYKRKIQPVAYRFRKV